MWWCLWFECEAWRIACLLGALADVRMEGLDGGGVGAELDVDKGDERAELGEVCAMHRYASGKSQETRSGLIEQRTRTHPEANLRAG